MIAALTNFIVSRVAAKKAHVKTNTAKTTAISFITTLQMEKRKLVAMIKRFFIHFKGLFKMLWLVLVFCQ